MILEKGFRENRPSLLPRMTACMLLACMWAVGPLTARSQPPRPPQAGAVPDPTRPAASMQDALKTHLSGLRSITLDGAVVAMGTGGVAMLRMQDTPPMLVRAGSEFTMHIAGLPLRVVVQDVTPAGVAIEAPTLNETLWIAGLLSPDMAPESALPGALRHVEFRDVALADAMRMLSDQSRENYSVSAKAGHVPVSLFLRNVLPDTVIKEICKSHNLWYRRDDETGVLRILTMAEFQQDLVSFRDEQTEVFTLLYPNVLDVAAAIQNLYGSRVVLSLGRDEFHDESRDLQRRFERFDLVDRRSHGLEGLNRYGGTSGAGTTVVSGGAYGSTVWQSGSGRQGGYLDTPSSRQVTTGREQREDADANAFRALTPGQAEHIERMLAAEAVATNEVGTLDVYRERPASILVTVSRRNNMVIVRTSDLRALEDIRALVRRMDVPTPLVLLEVNVLSISLTDDFRSVFDYQFNAAGSAGNNEGLVTAKFSGGEILPPAQGSMTPGGTGINAGDMTFQVVNEYFRARIQLLEEKGRVKSLAAPLLLTAHNEVARLFLGEERPLVRNITGQTLITDGASATTPDTTLEFRPVGTTLLLTPNINSDRTVTLRLLQENSDIVRNGATIPIVHKENVQMVPVDVVRSRTISGTFVARDGMAVAAGGIIEESTSDIRSQVPVLGSIPLLGTLFRREVRATRRSELVILIRPHVISTPSDGEAISRKLLQELSVDPVFRQGRPFQDRPHDHNE